MPDSADTKTDVRWLALGAILGLLAVGVGLFRQADRNSVLPETVVARVNDRLISRDIYDRALDRLRADSSNALDGDDEAWVLQRLVEEELLVQRGLALGMAQSENAVRSAIVQSLVASVTAAADAASPDDEALREYFNDHPERFSYTGAMAVDVWSASDEQAARDFLHELQRGNPHAAMARRLPTVPGGPLPLSKLRDYLGPGITAAAAKMPVGSSTVFAQQGRWLIVYVLSREQPTPADFASMQAQVLLDYRRNLADTQLRDYLDNLMQQADVVLGRP